MLSPVLWCDDFRKSLLVGIGESVNTLARNLVHIEASNFFVSRGYTEICETSHTFLYMIRLQELVSELHARRRSLKGTLSAGGSVPVGK